MNQWHQREDLLCSSGLWDMWDIIGYVVLKGAMLNTSEWRLMAAELGTTRTEDFYKFSWTKVAELQTRVGSEQRQICVGVCAWHQVGQGLQGLERENEQQKELLCLETQARETSGTSNCQMDWT